MIIETIELQTTSRSYINCLYAVLKHSKQFSCPDYMLAGMTGVAFKFVISKSIIPSSLDMYDWYKENKRGVDNIGIYNEIHMGNNSNEVFILYQKESLKKVKNSIDRGMAVIVWGIEKACFSLVYGYDEKDNVLYFINGKTGKKGVLLYDNFCIIREGKWYYQLFGEKIHRNLRDIYSDSLLIAIDEWEQEYKLGSLTLNQYASGRRAYVFLIEALKNVQLHIGAYDVMDQYIKAKRETSLYMKELVKELPKFTQASQCYNMINDLFQSIRDIDLRFNIEEDKKYIPLLVNIFTKAQELEEEAISLLKSDYRELINNRRKNPLKIDLF